MTKKIDSENCKNLTFKLIFLRQKLSEFLRKKNSLKNINLGQQLLLKSFFDKFNFKNNLLLKLGCKLAIFLNLTTLLEKLQKKFWCNFCDSTIISFIVVSFHQIPLTWWNAYMWCFFLQNISSLFLSSFFNIFINYDNVQPVENCQGSARRSHIPGRRSSKCRLSYLFIALWCLFLKEKKKAEIDYIGFDNLLLGLIFFLLIIIMYVK